MAGNDGVYLSDKVTKRLVQVAAIMWIFGFLMGGLIVWLLMK